MTLSEASLSLAPQTCSDCGRSEPEVTFDVLDPFTRPRKRSYCNACRYRKRKERLGAETLRKLSAKTQEKDKLDRKSNRRVEKWILIDSRQADRRRGYANDLDTEFIAAIISSGCSYCGETTIRMTLDRKNNNIGHTKLNVVAACIRCNCVRGNMPFKAWLVVAKGMREARENGLFENWSGRRR